MAPAGKQPILVDGDGEADIHGDILETVFSQVPLVDLVSASQVSKSWSRAVSSSLRHQNKPRPWLILHAQATRSPYTTTTHAYDPRSDVWIAVPRPPVDYVSPLKSSHSNFLYMLSPSRFSLSFDPFNFDWHHAQAPRVWRRDPIVALMGNNVVIAGGGCDFEDDPLAVEIYDLRTREWRACNSMPLSFRDSASTQWLSIAATAEELIVVDKESGSTYWFDLRSESWTGPFRLDAGQPVAIHNVGFTNSGLILVGLCKIDENVEQIKIWKIDREELRCKEIGEMPAEYVEKLRSGSFGDCSVDIRVAGNTVYVYSSHEWNAEELVACEVEVGGRGGLKWWSVRNVAARESAIAERMVFTCAEVGIGELERVITVANRGFEVRSVS